MRIKVVLALIMVALNCYWNCVAEVNMSGGESALLRYDCEFGDSIKTVDKKEKLEENIVKNIQPNREWRTYGEGKVDGIDKSLVRYHFDDAFGMDEMYVEYNTSGLFGIPLDYSEISKDWKSISAVLKNQLGRPIVVDHKKHHECMGYALASAYQTVNFYTDNKAGTGGISNYEEWLIPYQSDFAKVEHVVFWIKPYWAEQRIYSHYVSYSFLSKSILMQEENDVQVTLKATLAPTPSPTPRPTPKPLDVRIFSVSIKKNSIGESVIYIVFQNVGDVPIDRVDFAVQCFDAYGNRLGRYSYTNCYYEASIIGKDQRSSTNHRYTMHDCDGTRNVKIAITKYHLTNGKTVIVPEEDWIWREY